MQPRRILAASALAFVTACAPSIPSEQPPASVAIAMFDPTKSEIPLPNDLLLQQDPATLGVPLAEAELLSAFQQQGGFPNDQEVAITIGFAEQAIHADGSVTTSAPVLDFASFTADTFFVYGITGQAHGEIPMDPPDASDYAVVDDGDGQSHGVLTLHHQGRQPWEPGQYMVLVRGGADGIKTEAGNPIYASQVFHLVAQGEDLTTEQTLGLLAATAGSRELAMPLAEQLNALQAGYAPAFAVADTRFPHQDLAILTTFKVAPTVTQVDLDPNRGLVPLPIDLLRDPRPASASCAECGKLTPLAACTLAAGHLDDTGVCVDGDGNPVAAAAGFAALDGFSTTAAILAPTSALIQASTVPGHVMLFDLSGATPELVDPSTYITEPCEMTQSGFSTVVALQPAGATSCDPSSVFRTRPLKDATMYAVVVTDGVLDKSNQPLGSGTVGKILKFHNPLVDASGVSQLQGIDDATAGALEVMRQELAPVLAAAAALDTPVTPDHVAMAYTFRTQSITSVATQLAMLPYNPALPAALQAALKGPGDVTTLDAAAAFAKYGVDSSVVPSGNIGAVYETTITTLNLLDPATGAFHADPSQVVPETIKVLVVAPSAAAAAAASVPNCPGSALRCAPMMIFHHGLGGGRADALTVADGFAAKGMVTVAIDAAKHGDRSFCAAGQTTTNLGGSTVPVCSDGAACVSDLPAGAQGDANPPGTCANGFFKRPVSTSCTTCWAATDGIPVVSSSFVVTANFFRTRDTFRQDIIDQSQLVHALAPATAEDMAANSLFTAMSSTGVVIDSSKVYFTGQSLGSIEGTMDVATNPRISKAVLNVGGGTIVDLFTNSPAFAPATMQLLAGMGITPGTPEYLQFLSVAKTILDPADPVNFAGHLIADPLPNLMPPLGGNLDGSVAQAPKSVLQQVAFCDQVVPNPFSYIWANTTGTSPMLMVDPTFGTGTGTFQLFMTGTSAPAAADFASCPAPGSTALPSWSVAHGFLSNWADVTMTARAQSDAATFLSADTLPASVVVLP